MILQIQRKGKKLLLNEAELHAYMDAKITEIGRFVSSLTVALIMVTLVAILTIFKAGAIFLYALIFLPVLARVYIGNKISGWLRSKFQDLIGI